MRPRSAISRPTCQANKKEIIKKGRKKKETVQKLSSLITKYKTQTVGEKKRSAIFIPALHSSFSLLLTIAYGWGCARLTLGIYAQKCVNKEIFFCWGRRKRRKRIFPFHLARAFYDAKFCVMREILRVRNASKKRYERT